MKLIESPEILHQYLLATSKEMRKRYGDGSSMSVQVATGGDKNQEADSACKHFASSGQWPHQISFEAFFQCRNRLLQAMEYLEFVTDSASNIPLGDRVGELAIEDEKFLNWLLIDLWHYGGKYRAIYTSYKGTNDQN